MDKSFKSSKNYITKCNKVDRIKKKLQFSHEKYVYETFELNFYSRC